MLKPKKKAQQKEKIKEPISIDSKRKSLLKPKSISGKPLKKPELKSTKSNVDYSLWKKHLRVTYFEGEGGKRTKGYIVTNKSDLKVLVKMLMEDDLIYFDTEFTSLMVQANGKSDLVGMSFSRTSDSDDDHYYIPFLHLEDHSEQIQIQDAVPILQPLWADVTKTFVGHGIKVDIHSTENVGLVLKTEKWIDTLVGVWQVDENLEKGLKTITKNVFGIAQQEYKEVIATVSNEIKKKYGIKSNAIYDTPISLTSIKEGAPYAIGDAYWTRLHWEKWIERKIADEGMTDIFFNNMMPFLRSTYNMERRGMRIDINRLNRMEQVATAALEDLEFKLVELAGIHIDISSPQQIAEILFGWKKMKEIKQDKVNKKTGEVLERAGDVIFVGNKHLVDNSFGLTPVNVSEKTGQPSVDEDTVLALLKQSFPNSPRKQEGLEFLKLYKKYTKVKKLLSTYIVGLREQIYPDGRVHPKFNVGGTVSGRLSSSDPNFQNLVRPVELNPPAMFKYLKDEKDEHLFKDIVSCFNFQSDDFDIYEKATPKKLLPKSKRGLVDKIDWQRWNKDLKKWRKSNEFEFMLKELEIRALVIPDEADEEFGEYEILAFDCA